MTVIKVVTGHNTSRTKIDFPAFRSNLGEQVKMTTNRIEINAGVMCGKPVIKGTRITVELILRKLSEGAREKDLLDAYPRLTREDIRAAIRYAVGATPP